MISVTFNFSLTRHNPDSNSTTVISLFPIKMHSEKFPSSETPTTELTKVVTQVAFEGAFSPFRLRLWVGYSK